jgi:hypothetical protein
MSVVLSPELARLEAAIDALATVDVRSLPEAQRLAQQEKLLELGHRLAAIELHGLARIDADETTVAVTGRATRSWLIEEQGLNPAEATRRLRLARALPAYPAVDGALSAGRISPDSARVIVTALASVPPQFLDTVEGALLTIAPHCTPGDLADEVDTLLVACGVESSADIAANKRLHKRGLTIARTFHGMRSVSGLLTPEVGEALEITLAQLAEPTGPEDDRTPAQRRHDAVGDLAGHYLAHADLPAVNGDRPRVVVTISYEALVNDLNGAWGRLPSGATICPQTARRLACDAEIIPAVLGARSDVLDIAVSSRSFSTAVRRAAWLEQDGRCAFPGCRRPPVDCHHIIWWTHGGASTLDNAAWLCAFHHWLIHERDWSMRREHDRTFTFIHPSGIEYRRRTTAA